MDRGPRVLHRVAVREVVRRLHQRDPVILEVPEGRVEEVGQRNVVGVEGHDQLAVGETERVVDVAGFGVGVVGPGDVPGAELGREHGDPGPAAVVEHVRRVRVGQRPAADERGLEHGDRLVVGAHEHVDRWFARPRWRLAGRDPPRGPRVEPEADEPERLGHDEHRVRDRAAPRQLQPIRQVRYAAPQSRATTAITRTAVSCSAHQEAGSASSPLAVGRLRRAGPFTCRSLEDGCCFAEDVDREPSRIERIIRRSAQPMGRSALSISIGPAILGSFAESTRRPTTAPHVAAAIAATPPMAKGTRAP